MKEEFRNAALAAVDFVNSKLGIKSTNRPGDQDSPEGIAKLGQYKKEFIETKSAKKLEPLGKWRIDLEAKTNEAKLLFKDLSGKNEKLHTDKTLDVVGKESLKQDIQRTMQSRNLLLEQCRKLEQDIKAAGDFSPLENARIAFKASQKSGFGNCEEKSAIAFFYLRARSTRPIELMSSGPHRSISGDSHQFVVIGRKKDENIDDPDKWSEAAVCDPWDNSVYEPSDLPDKLTSFGYLDVINLGVRED